MAQSKQYTPHQVSDMLNIPITEIEWYLRTGLVKGKKRGRKGGWFLSEEEIQRIYDLYSNRYSYVSEEEMEKLIHGE